MVGYPSRGGDSRTFIHRSASEHDIPPNIPPIFRSRSVLCRHGRRGRCLWRASVETCPGCADVGRFRNCSTLPDVPCLGPLPHFIGRRTLPSLKWHGGRVAFHGRNSAVFRKSVRSLAGWDSVAWCAHPIRWSRLYDGLGLSGVGSLAIRSDFVALWHASRRALSCNGTPPPLGIDETPFQPLTFFGKKQAVFLNPSICFPPQIDGITQYDRFSETRDSRAHPGCQDRMFNVCASSLPNTTSR